MAIMMPTLSSARNQAKVVTCKANSKQIATLVNLYQTDWEGYAPVVLNLWSLPYAPPKGVNLSVALMDYTDIKLPGTWNINDFFFGGPGRVSEYYEEYLPKYFVCPCNRGKEYNADQHWKESGSISIAGQRYKTYIMSTFTETYGTFLWPKEKNDEICSLGTSEEDGIRKHGVLNWWNHQTAPKSGSNLSPLSNYSALTPVRWSTREVKETNASSLGDATIFYCGAGEFLGSDGTASSNGNTGVSIMNPGQHKTGSSGGTIAAFGDMHIEWVKGTRIGDK